MASNADDLSPEVAHGISRRSIVKGAAWTVPAVIIATAVPAAATASGTMLAISASGHKLNPGPGSAGRVVTLTVNFAGTSPGAHTVTFTSVTSAGRTWSISGSPANIPSGGGPVTFTATSSDNLPVPSPITVTIGYSVTGHTTGTIAASIDN